jgi:Double zinc ribbon
MSGDGARKKASSLQLQDAPLNLATYSQGVHVPQRVLLEHKSVASQDTSAEPMPAGSESEKEISRPPLSKLQPCFHCNREISINDKFCKHCGESVASTVLDGSTRLCSSCRNQIGVSDKFCRHCGASSIAVVAPSMNFINEGHHEVIRKRARATRKRTPRKKVIRPEAESSQPDGKSSNEQTTRSDGPAPNDMPKESRTAVLKA